LQLELCSGLTNTNVLIERKKTKKVGMRKEKR